MVCSTLFALGETHWFSQGKYTWEVVSWKVRVMLHLKQQREFLHTTNRAAHLWLGRSTGAFHGVDAALWAFGMEQKNVFHLGHYLEVGTSGMDGAQGGRSGEPWAARAENAGENGATEVQLVYLTGTPYGLCNTCTLGWFCLRPAAIRAKCLSYRENSKTLWITSKGKYNRVGRHQRQCVCKFTTVSSNFYSLPF